MPSAAEVAGTESLDNGLAVEALIFPAYPIGKHHVQVVHNFDKLGLAKLVVVIVPTSDLALNLYPHLLEFPVKMRMQNGSLAFSSVIRTSLQRSPPQRFRLHQLAEGLMPVPAHRHRETFSHLIGSYGYILYGR